MPPVVPDHATLKHPAHDSGRMRDKRRRRTGTDGLFALCESVDALTDGWASGSGIPASGETSPDRMTCTIQILQNEVSNDNEALEAIGLLIPSWL